MIGTEWQVVGVSKITDGDTVRLIRSRPVELDGGRYLLIDRDLAGVPIRLAWVDTPERGQDGWTEARADLVSWIESRKGTGKEPLRVLVYESAGWERLLGDLQDAAGDSASQWLMRERGWPPYVPR